MAQPQILLCTVGTSLFKPNLEGLKKQLAEGTIDSGKRALAEAYQAKSGADDLHAGRKRARS